MFDVIGENTVCLRDPKEQGELVSGLPLFVWDQLNRKFKLLGGRAANSSLAPWTLRVATPHCQCAMREIPGA